MKRVIFSNDELRIVGAWPAPLPFLPDIQKLNYPITQKENYLEMFNHRAPLWMPSSGDVASTSPNFLPDFASHNLPEGGGDYFGVQWECVGTPGESMVRPGNPLFTDANLWCGQYPINDKAMLFDKYGDRIILGVEPPTLPENASDNEVYRTAEEFAEQYCGIEGKAVFYSSMGTDSRMQTAVYEASRKRLCG